MIGKLLTGSASSSTEVDSDLSKMEMSFTGNNASHEISDVGVDAPQGDGAEKHHMEYIKITWDDLVTRMESYIRNHLFEPTKSCTDIIDLLRCHLLKGRDIGDSLNTGGSLDESRRKQYIERQNNLNRHGIATLMAEILTSNRVGQDGDFADMAVELLAEMLEGGNKNVQQSIFLFVTTKDPKGAFLSHIKDRLGRAERAVRERKDAVRVKYIPFGDDLLKEYDEMIQTFRFIQLMCEGHTLEMQNLMRSQDKHGSTVSINLLLQAIDILTLQVESSAILRRFDEKDLEATEACLDFLIEALQGPCPDNQIFIVKHLSPAPAIEACKQIIPSQFHSRCSKEGRLRVQGRAVKLLAACLEGRTDSACHLELATLVEPDMIRAIRQTVVKRYMEIETDASGNRRGGFVLSRAGMNRSEDDEDELAGDVAKRQALDDAVAVLVDIQSVSNELATTAEFVANDSFETSALQRESAKMKAARLQHSKDMEFVKDKIGTVEIFWNGRTESVSFPLPLTHRCLQSSSRAAFLNSVDLSTTEKRMKELVMKSDDFFGEMQHLYELEEKSLHINLFGSDFNAYKVLKANLPQFKRYVYFLNVFLNMTTLVDKETWKQDPGKGLETQSHQNVGLVVLLLAGYSVISGYYVLAEFPVLKRKLEQQREAYEKEIDEAGMKKRSEM